MGRLVVEDADEAIEEGMGLPGRSCGEGDWVGFCAIVGTLALDLRLEPNPRLLNREFIELIWPRKEGRRGRREQQESLINADEW